MFPQGHVWHDAEVCADGGDNLRQGAVIVIVVIAEQIVQQLFPPVPVQIGGGFPKRLSHRAADDPFLRVQAFAGGLARLCLPFFFQTGRAGPGILIQPVLKCHDAAEGQRDAGIGEGRVVGLGEAWILYSVRPTVAWPRAAAISIPILRKISR